jgi:hypothetical protein
MNSKSAVNPQNWDRIRVTQDGGDIFIDATGDYMADNEYGDVRYKTKYKIDGHSITTLSHDVQVHRKLLSTDEQSRATLTTTFACWASNRGGFSTRRPGGS